MWPPIACTTVSLRARVLVPAAEVEIVVEPADAGPASTVPAKLENEQVTAQLTISKSARYRFAVRGPSGIRSIETTPRSIEAEPDHSPEVQLMAPADTLDVTNLKRVELAMVLAQRPRLLLMDEPTAGMAPEERDALMKLAADLARGENIAVLFTEHDMEVVFGFADRVIALHLGKLIAEGPPDQVRADARLREVYLGDA